MECHKCRGTGRQPTDVPIRRTFWEWFWTEPRKRYVTEKCCLCKGTGYLPSFDGMCLKCQGTGKIVLLNLWGDNYTFGTREGLGDCPKCHGSGLES